MGNRQHPKQMSAIACETSRRLKGLNLVPELSVCSFKQQHSSRNVDACILSCRDVRNNYVELVPVANDRVYELLYFYCCFNAFVVWEAVNRKPINHCEDPFKPVNIQALTEKEQECRLIYLIGNLGKPFNSIVRDGAKNLQLLIDAYSSLTLECFAGFTVLPVGKSDSDDERHYRAYCLSPARSALVSFKPSDNAFHCFLSEFDVLRTIVHETGAGANV